MTMKSENAAASPLFGRIRRAKGKLAKIAWAAETTPWLVGSVEYTERYWSLVRQGWRWRMAWLFSTALNGVLAACIVWLAGRSQAVPYIVQVDEHGRAVRVGPAQEGSLDDPDLRQKVVLHSLDAWIWSMRSVVGESETQMKLVRTVFAMLSAGTAAIEQAKTWYRANDPFEAGSKRVYVEEIRVEPYGSASTYRAEWTERIREGSSEKRARFSAVVEVKFSPASLLADDEQANPLGVFVTDYSIRQLQ